MNYEQALALLGKIQNGTATKEEQAKKLEAFAVVMASAGAKIVGQ